MNERILKWIFLTFNHILLLTQKTTSSVNLQFTVFTVIKQLNGKSIVFPQTLHSSDISTFLTFEEGLDESGKDESNNTKVLHIIKAFSFIKSLKRTTHDGKGNHKGSQGQWVFSRFSFFKQHYISTTFLHIGTTSLMPWMTEKVTVNCNMAAGWVLEKESNLEKSGWERCPTLIEVYLHITIFSKRNTWIPRKINRRWQVKKFWNSSWRDIFALHNHR